MSSGTHVHEISYIGWCRLVRKRCARERKVVMGI